MADILVLTTGGTIDKLYFDALSEYQIGDSVVDRLLATAQIAPAGVWIAMNGTVFAADRVRKDRAANAFVAV